VADIELGASPGSLSQFGFGNNPNDLAMISSLKFENVNPVLWQVAT
jgi:hypothetical protein